VVTIVFRGLAGSWHCPASSYGLRLKRHQTTSTKREHLALEQSSGLLVTPACNNLNDKQIGGRVAIQQLLFKIRTPQT
jgi:hypothetical protein